MERKGGEGRERERREREEREREERERERRGGEGRERERGGEYFEPPDYLASCLLQIVYSTKHISREKHQPACKIAVRCPRLRTRNALH